MKKKPNEILFDARFELASAANQLKYCAGDFDRNICSSALIQYIDEVVIPMPS